LFAESAGGFGGFQFADEIIEGGEVDRVPGLACGDREGDRDACLADSWWAE
jgi:hypothetical protein